jgi:hypothetical protein
VEELLFSVIELHNASDVRQIDVHRAEPLVPGPLVLKLQLPGSDEIPAELIQAGGEMLLSVIH